MIDDADLEEASKKFWSKVDIKSPEECWFRDCAIGPTGYSRWFFKGKVSDSHRAAYELYVGEIPPLFQIDHLCRVRACVNPYHLDAVTQRTNLLRGFGASGKNARKTHCPRGHPLEGDNLKLRYKSGGRIWRECRMCDNARQRRRRKELARKAGLIGPGNVWTP